jgi:hypothetical protein
MHVENPTDSIAICYCQQIKHDIVLNVNVTMRQQYYKLVSNLRIPRHLAVTF